MDLRRDHVGPSDRLNSRARAVPAAATVAAGSLAAWLVLRRSWEASSLGDRERWWAVFGVFAMSVAVAWALPTLRRLLPRPGDVPLVLAGVLLTIYLCVPESDQIHTAAVLVGIVPIVEGVARWRFPLPVLGLLATYVMWTGVFGATGRQSALVGVLVAWWPVLLLPLLSLRFTDIPQRSVRITGAITAVGWIAAVAVARTGALQPTIGPALVATGLAIPLSLVVAVALLAATNRRDRADDLSARP